MTHYPDTPQCFYRISAKALIINQDRQMLLIREDSGLWELAGGGIDHGETAHEALAREIDEEMGLRTTHIDTHPSYFFLCESSGAHGIVRPLAQVIYRVTLAGLDFRASPECEEIGFFSPEQARTLASPQSLRKFLTILADDPY